MLLPALFLLMRHPLADAQGCFVMEAGEVLCGAASAREAGLYAHLMKPIDLQELIRYLRRA